VLQVSARELRDSKRNSNVAGRALAFLAEEIIISQTDLRIFGYREWTLWLVAWKLTWTNDQRHVTTLIALPPIPAAVM
jgi:hypothetical protein